MNATQFEFELITETFAHGAYQTQNFNRPELRAPPVKGMLRWWHEALGFSKRDALAIFGSVANKKEQTQNQASAVSIRVSPLGSPRISKADFMPHKGSRGGTKSALLPGSRYQLVLSPRRGGLDSELESQLLRATRAWLLFGAIGQRSNRAAGSIQWSACPADEEAFELEGAKVLGNANIRFAFLPASLGGSAHTARELSGDFLEDSAFHGSMAPFGSARPRKPSPLKLKCLRFGDELCLLAIWDRRNESEQELKSGISTLVNSGKEIGRLLENALPRLTA